MMQVVQSQPTGWMCPSCGKAHGPHVDTCPGWPQASSAGLPMRFADFVGPRDPRHITRPTGPIYDAPYGNPGGGWAP